MSWGTAEWGTSPWGGAEGTGPGSGGGGTEPPAGPPVITPLNPLANATGVGPGTHVIFSITDDVGVDLSTLLVAVGGTNYIVAGVPVNGAAVTFDANAFNGYDIDLTLPGLLPIGSRVEVFIAVFDTDLVESTKGYFFTVSTGPRIIQVRNPQEKILLVQFNQPMRQNSSFFSLHSWKIEPVTNGNPITILEVQGNAGQPETALLVYEGGSAALYLLTVFNVLSQNNEPIEQGYNTAQFLLAFPQEEEATVRLFDTVFGPVGIVQQLRTRRTIDGHVMGRSLALAMDEQFRLRLQTKDATIGRDGRPGRLRAR